MSSTPEKTNGEFDETAKHEALHLEDAGGKYADLSETQRTLALAGEAERAKDLGTFSAIRYYWVAFLWAQFGCLGTILNGFDSSVTGAVISVPAFRETLGDFINGQHVVSAKWQVGFNVANTVGCVIGLFFFPIIGDRLGRKGSLLVASIISIGAVFLEFFITEGKQVMWLFGKGINGMGLGIYIATSSSYAIEVSPLSLRGFTTGAVNFYIVIGQFLSSIVIQATGARTGRAAFQIPIAVQWALSAVVLIILPFCPESPWVLVKQGKVDQAKHSLKRLYGNTEDDLDLHLKVIEDTIAFEARLHSKARWADLWKGHEQRRTWIILLMYVCQQVTGVQFVLGYSTYFFELAGFTVANAFALNVGTLSIALVSNLLGLFMMRRAGRRNIFLASTYACTIDCLLIGICSLIQNNAALWAMATFTMLYMLTFQFGLGPITFTYTAEVGSARLRSQVIAWGNMCNQFFGLIINIINPYMINPDEANLQGKVGWIFGGMAVFACLGAWLWVPETGGRTTDELDLMFKKKVPARQFKDYVITHEDRLEMEHFQDHS